MLLFSILPQFDKPSVIRFYIGSYTAFSSPLIMIKNPNGQFIELALAVAVLINFRVRVEPHLLAVLIVPHVVPQVKVGIVRVQVKVFLVDAFHCRECFEVRSYTA